MKKPKYQIGDKVYKFDGTVDGLPDISEIEITGVKLMTGNRDSTPFENVYYTNQKGHENRPLFNLLEDELFPSKKEAAKEAVLFFKMLLSEVKA